MHPEKSGLEECDLIYILKVVDKETQTSNTLVSSKSKTSHKLPLPRDIVTSDKGSITVFEFSHVLQDSDNPKSITIVKETLTEEIVNHSKGSSTEDAVSNRYRYCKEVIKPYLKSYLQDCPDSEEQLIRDVIHSTDQEYPDYQPCFEVYEGNKDIEEKKSHSDRSSVSKIDAVTSYNSKLSGTKMESKDCLPQAKESSTSLKNTKSPAKDKDPISGIQDPVCDKDKSAKPMCKPKTSDTIVKPKCVKKKESYPKVEDSSCPPKEDKPLPKPDFPPPAVSCKESKSLEKEPKKSKCSLFEYFGITNPIPVNKPSYEEKDPPKSETMNVEVKEKTIVEAHSETIGTIKIAMEEFITKFYKTTQEAVSVIKTESAKQIDLFRKSKSNNTENIQPKASCENKTSETITGFSFLRRIESKDKKDDSTDDQESISPGKILERIVGKVDSTVSMISDHITLDKIPDMLKPSKFKDPSSPYDIPTPPKEISNIIINEPVPNSNSVFAAIKNRICSMFCESDNSPKAATGSSSPSSSPPPTKDESDEDLINRLIE